MGCGSYENKGYTFIPDGSCSIVRFEDFAGTGLTVSGKLYGQDTRTMKFQARIRR